MLADDGELSQESSKDSFIDKDDICAKIESLGGMVIEKYDEEIVSIFSKVFRCIFCCYKLPSIQTIQLAWC